MPAPARGAERADQRPHVAQHPPSVHEHLVQALNLLLGGGELRARVGELALQVGDPRLEVGHAGQPLLGVDEQRRKRVGVAGGNSIGRVGGGLGGHRREATALPAPRLGPLMADVEFIVAPGQPYAARELAETLVHELSLQEMPGNVTLADALAPVEDVDALLPVYVLVDPRPLVSADGPELPGPELLRRTVVVWTGPPPSAADADALSPLRWAGAVFASSQRSVAALHRVGIKARLLRAGYSERLDHFEPDTPRRIDVLFLGTESARRRERLARARQVLNGTRFEIVTADATPHADDPQARLAAPRWELLAQAKILLSIHVGEDRAVDWSGVLDAIHAGAVVVTEHSSQIAPLVPGEHLIAASPEGLPHVARALLRDPERLRTIRGEAHARLRDWIPYALWASILRAAVVELIGEPIAVPPGYD